MQIVCPNCNARYLAPDTQIGPNGRRVRCARCANVWRVEAPDPEAVISAAAEPVTAGVQAASAPAASVAETDPSSETPIAAPIKVDPLPRNRAPATGNEKPSPRRLAGWIAFAAIIIAILTALYLGREAIMRVWPASTQLYKKVGLAGGPMDRPVEKARELEVSNLANEWVENGNGLELVLRGNVTNRSSELQDAPYLRIRLYGRDNSIVRDKRQPLEGGPIRPGEARAFAMRFQDPGDVARALPALE
jgi:predicted Zn finger-like uncharacterized protein